MAFQWYTLKHVSFHHPKFHFSRLKKYYGKIHISQVLLHIYTILLHERDIKNQTLKSSRNSFNLTILRTTYLQIGQPQLYYFLSSPPSFTISTTIVICVCLLQTAPRPPAPTNTQYQYYWSISTVIISMIFWQLELLLKNNLVNQIHLHILFVITCKWENFSD